MIEVSAFGVINKAVMYHGTSARNARKIMRQGYEPSSNGAFGPGVYLTKDKEYAERFARHVGHGSDTNWHGSKPPSKAKKVLRSFRGRDRLLVTNTKGMGKERITQSPQGGDITGMGERVYRNMRKPEGQIKLSLTRDQKIARGATGSAGAAAVAGIVRPRKKKKRQ